MNKYKPSKEFVFSVFLVFSSFLILQNLIIPDIVNKDLTAQLISFTSKSAETTQSGVLRIQYFEELNPKTKKMVITEKSYFLENTNGKSVQIYPKSVDESLDGLNVDYKNGEVLLSKVQSSKLNSKKRSKGDVEVIKTLVLLAEFGNSNPIEATAQDFQDLLFTKSTQSYLKRFFSEMTHGKVQIGGDVFGWYRFKGNGASYTRPANMGGGGQCFLTKSNIENMIDFYNVSISQYDRIITISNCQEYDTIGGAMYGSGDFGIPLIRTSSNSSRLDLSGFNGYGTFGEPVWNIIHEMGHTFGLPHSSSLDCNEKTIWNDCFYVEYGNPFDAMGHWSGRIFSFLQQQTAGWIDESNILEISEPGDYFINNLQTEDGIVGAKILVPGIPYPVFGLEHRKSVGFDVSLSEEAYGLLLYSRIGPNQSILPVTPLNGHNAWRLVDPHPTDQDIHDDTVHDSISVGNSFYDPVFGLNIEVMSVTPEGTNFRVTYDYENSICGTENKILSESLCRLQLLEPINFTGSITSSGINLTWENQAINATNLVIESRTLIDDAYTTWITISDSISPDATSYNVTENIFARNYYRIRAENSNLGTSSSSWVNTSSINLPLLLPPINFTGSITSSGINLTWENQAINATNLTLERVDEIDEPYQFSVVSDSIPPDATSYFVEENISSEKRYRIRVEDSNTNNYSYWTPSIAIIFTPLSPPINFSGTATPSGINFTWENQEANATNLVLRKLIYIEGVGSWITVSGSIPPDATSYTVTDSLTPSFFNLRVENLNTNQFSSWVSDYI